MSAWMCMVVMDCKDSHIKHTRPMLLTAPLPMDIPMCLETAFMLLWYLKIFLQTFKFQVLSVLLGCTQAYIT